MPRTKTVAKKSIPPRRAQRPQQASPSPMPSKKCKVAQSDPAKRVKVLPSKTPWAKSRHSKLLQQTFGAHKYLKWAVQGDYGKEDEIRKLISIGPWAALFAISTPAYKDITLEVLSTWKITEIDGGYKADDIIGFQAFKKVHKITMADFY